MSEKNLYLLTSLGMDKEKGKCSMLSILSSTVSIMKEEVLKVISSCLQNEQMTQIYCTHSQELRPKLVPIWSHVSSFACGEGFKQGGKWRRWQFRDEVLALGCASLALLLGSVPVKAPHILSSFLTFCLLSPCPSRLFSLPSLFPPPPPPPSPSLCFSYIHTPHFTYSFQLARGFWSMFPVRITSDRHDTENGKQMARLGRASIDSLSLKSCCPALTGSEHFATGAAELPLGGLADCVADSITKPY